MEIFDSRVLELSEARLSDQSPDGSLTIWPTRDLALPRSIGYIRHCQTFHALDPRELIEVVEKVPEQQQVLLGVLSKVVRMPPEMEDAARPGRSLHPGAQTCSSERIEPSATGVVWPQEGTGGHVAESGWQGHLVPRRDR